LGQPAVEVAQHRADKQRRGKNAADEPSGEADRGHHQLGRSQGQQHGRAEGRFAAEHRVHRLSSRPLDLRQEKAGQPDDSSGQGATSRARQADVALPPVLLPVDQVDEQDRGRS
jgi:hypothetical protein